MAEGYTDHFVIFADLLGFGEAMAGLNAERRLRTLNLLTSLAALRGNFSLTAIPSENGMTANFRPEVSTFSDNIVISYPLASMTKELSPHSVPIFVLSQSQTLLSILASQALRLGFLLRGGAAIGRLYHDSGVIFGDALVEAYRLESQIAIYRRVILSPGITSHPVGKTYTMEC